MCCFNTSFVNERTTWPLVSGAFRISPRIRLITSKVALGNDMLMYVQGILMELLGYSKCKTVPKLNHFEIRE